MKTDRKKEIPSPFGKMDRYSGSEEGLACGAP